MREHARIAAGETGRLTEGALRGTTCRMTDQSAEITPEFQRGWNAALLAARQWHESQAKKTLVQAGRSRFPKTLEREAEVHQLSAERVVLLSPDDV